MNQGQPPSPERGELRAAIQALVGRLSETLTGPQAQRVKEDLEANAREIGRQIDQALDAPAAQALKERIAVLVRTVQEHLGGKPPGPPPVT